MADQEHRRRFKRQPVHWKAAVVFEKMNGKPVVHTETQDLSIGGAAILSNYSDVTGSLVAMLLAPPPQQGGEIPKMLKIRARVVSSVHLPAMSGFRHGLSFVQLPDDAMNVLAGILRAAEAGSPSGEAAPATNLAATPAASAAPAPQPAPAASSRLAKFKQLAQSKQVEEQKSVPQEQINARVSTAVERTYRYLKEFTEQLNIVKPAYAREYSIVGVPKFDGLVWTESRIDLRTRETSPITKVFEQFTLQFKLVAKRQIRVTRDCPADERLKQQLFETMIKFTTQEERSERGSVVRRTFILPCEVEASLQLAGNFRTGMLILRTRNVGHFGLEEHVLAPEAITEESLDELTGFILGESGHIGPLLLQGT